MGSKATVAYLNHRTGETEWKVYPKILFRASDAVSLAIRILSSMPNLEDPIQSIYLRELTEENAPKILMKGIEKGDYNFNTLLAGYIIYKCKGTQRTNPSSDKNSNVIPMFKDPSA